MAQVPAPRGLPAVAGLPTRQGQVDLASSVGTRSLASADSPSAAAVTSDAAAETLATSLPSGRTPSALLEVRDLTVQFAGEDKAPVTVVAGVSFAIRPGELVGILGESGCGKTTTALALVRILPPNAKVVCGSVNFSGRELLTATERELETIRGAEISLVYQEPGIALLPVRCVGDQVAEVIRAHSNRDMQECRREAAAVLAQVFPREATRIFAAYPHQLSGGQRQRVLIAQALACRPALLVADEPTASLDTTTQAEILALIKELRQRLGIALLLITHSPAILAGLADLPGDCLHSGQAGRVLVMYAGRVVEEGPLEQVFREPLHPYTRALLQCVPNPAGDFSARTTRLPVIAGAPPDPARLPPGCAFEPRCADRMASCVAREPREVWPAASRRVRCFKYGD